MTPFVLTCAVLIAAPVGFLVYAYLLYPAILWLLARLVGRPPVLADPAEWPSISVCLPAYNEERSIRRTIERILAVDYPADRRQVLIVSDASTDGTDDIVREFAGQGVQLLRMPVRGGKSVAENAAVGSLRGDIVINMDATIGIARDSFKQLVRGLTDPSVGVASGRDVSVGSIGEEANTAESGYVGYEMWVRGLETRLGTIVGASGCFYAIRRELIVGDFPPELSRDFAAPLIVHEKGFRSVSVDEAVCFVPRTPSLSAEYRRKIRTMARGIDTLFYKGHLLNPFAHGRFALMLLSHKLARWLGLLLLPGAAIGIALLSVWSGSTVADVLFVLGLVAAGVGLWAVRQPEGTRLHPLAARLGYLFASGTAGFLAWMSVIRGQRSVLWEPTRRPTI